MLRRFIGVAEMAVMICGVMGASLMAQARGDRGPSAEMPAWQREAGGTLAFEVATVKPSVSDSEPQVNFTLGSGDAYAPTGGRMRTSGISLLDYVRFAYKLSDGQVRMVQAEAPKWIATKKFDIEAKAEDVNATKDQMRLMMQSLLSERFGLKAHWETRQMPVLALVLARAGKMGPQLRAHDPGDPQCSHVGGGAERVGSTVCGGLVSLGGASAPSHVRIGGRKIPMALVAAHLGEMAGFDRPVVDETGLGGTFDLTLEWGPEEASGAGMDADHEDRQTEVEEALQDQLGLKLRREKGPVEVLVVDRIREPDAD